jgi:hypothetical protein
MKSQSEHNYMLTELESLGIKREVLQDSNGMNEIENLVDNIKQTYIQDYRSFYGQDEFS